MKKLRSYSILTYFGVTLIAGANSETTPDQTCDLIAGDSRTTNCSTATITWSDDHRRCVDHMWGKDSECTDTFDNWWYRYFIYGASTSGDVLILRTDPKPVATECGESWTFLRLDTGYNLDSWYRHTYISWGSTYPDCMGATGCIEIDL
jgi:hypothetical protein